MPTYAMLVIHLDAIDVETIWVMVHYVCLQEPSTPKPEQPAYLSADWPSKKECDEHKSKTMTWEDYPSTFLPPENKGFE